MREELIAIEGIITRFAEEQFTANKISPVEAAIIMEAVSGKVQRHCLESVIMGMVVTGEKRTGTVEDLKEDMGCTENT
jgi:hypothetical protein